MYPKFNRMWFNISYNGANNHWLHNDGSENSQTILLFLTPVWKTGWRGSFYVDGKEFTFEPGSAIVFDSKEFHTEKSLSLLHIIIEILRNIVIDKQ